MKLSPILALELIGGIVGIAVFGPILLERILKERVGALESAPKFQTKNNFEVAPHCAFF